MTPKDYLREPYTRSLIPDESGGFHAEILEFPGCFAEGETVEETYKELEDAAEAWIEARLSQRQEVPAPFNNLGYSGNISLRLPRSIHKRATIMAERDRVSLNSFLVTAIASRVGAEDLYNVFENRFVRAAMPFVHYFGSTAVNTEQRKISLNFKPKQIASTTGALNPLAALRR